MYEKRLKVSDLKSVKLILKQPDLTIRSYRLIFTKKCVVIDYCQHKNEHQDEG